MRKAFQIPTVRVFMIAHTDLVRTSTDSSGRFTMGGWHNFDGSAWNGTLPSGGGSGLGGWTDNGGSAWE